MNISKTPIWEVMEKNYMYNLTVEQFARMANRSLSVFKKEFFQYYHTTPGRWLTQKRLELAKSFLDAGKQNIGEVAFNSGFENLSHFSRGFKEKFGVTPTKMRTLAPYFFFLSVQYKPLSKKAERLSKNYFAPALYICAII